MEQCPERKNMGKCIGIYSIANKELTVYRKNDGLCIICIDVSNNNILHRLEKAMDKYEIDDSDLHIGL